ncbi:hypothetical protein D3C87_2051630 [compost metagenome]
MALHFTPAQAPLPTLEAIAGPAIKGAETLPGNLPEKLLHAMEWQADQAAGFEFSDR